MPAGRAASSAAGGFLRAGTLIGFTPDPAVGPLPEKVPIGANSLVQPGYFETMGIRLVDGRPFTSTDLSSTTRAVIVNETAARRLMAQVPEPYRESATRDRLSMQRLKVALSEAGEAIGAKTVLSSTAARRTLIDLVDVAQLDPEFVHTVGNIRARGVRARDEKPALALETQQRRHDTDKAKRGCQQDQCHCRE